MSLADLRTLPCSACGRASDLLVLLDRARGARAGTRAVAVSCPACGAEAHLELGDGSAAVGALVAGRDGGFRPERRVAQPGLRVRGGPDGLVVELLHRRWAIPFRRAAAEGLP